MIGKSKLLAVGALVAGLLLPAQAMAAWQAHPAVDLNLRVGPSTAYGVIDVVPAGHPVTVFGCLELYEWCDIDFLGLRGWVYAAYLVQPGTALYLPHWGPQVGLTVISFSFNVYHDRYYRGKPWYKHRKGRWDGHKEVRKRQYKKEQQAPQQVKQAPQRVKQAPQQVQKAAPTPRRPRASQAPRQQIQQAPQRQQTRQSPRRQQIQQAPQHQQTRQQSPRRPVAGQGQRSSRAIQQQGRSSQAAQAKGGGGEKRKRRNR